MNELLSLINQFRAQPQVCGVQSMPAVAPLRWNTMLGNAAARHSGDMALKNWFSHTGTDGSSARTRIAAAGYNYSWWAENIAGGSSSAAGAFQQWRESPPHCWGMMQAEPSEMGASCVARRGTDFMYYWTLDLARPR